MGTPSFLRTGSTCRIAWCSRGAKQKQIPSSSRQASTPGDRGLDVDAQGRQGVGRAAAAGDAAVAVLGHRHPGRRRHQGRGRADVEGPRAVAAGAAGIHQADSAGADGGHVLPQGGGRAGHLRHCLALVPQRQQEPGDFRLAARPPLITTPEVPRPFAPSVVAAGLKREQLRSSRSYQDIYTGNGLP